MATAWLALAVVLVPGCGGGARRTTDGSPGTPAVRDTGKALSSDLALTARLLPEKPGCAAAVGESGSVVWSGARGIADLTTGRPLTPDTVFDIASVSKQFTAAAILLLVASRRLSVEDTLADHLPGMPRWAKLVTIDQMVHHTSGIADYTDLLPVQGYPFSRRTTQAQAVRAVAGTPATRFRPGTSFEYSNSNYLLLAEIVHRVAGTPLPTFLRKEVFEPLGLRMVMDPVAKIPAKAISYADGRAGQGPQVTDSPWEEVGDGGIQTTPGELVRWADNYRTGAVGGRALLDAQLADRVPTDLGDGFEYGAGIVATSDGTLVHEGRWEGFRTAFEVTPDRRTAFAVSCNSADLDPAAIVQDLRRIWA